MGIGSKIDQATIDEKKMTERKESKINGLKANTKTVITGRFPIEQQVDLYDGTKEDIPDKWFGNRVSNYETVKSFKKEMINIEGDLNSEIENATTLEELENIDVSPSNIVNKSSYSYEW